jgi:hypothetical protein
MFCYEIVCAGEALHCGSCFFDPTVHKEFQVTVQNIGDVIYTAPGAGHQGIGIVCTCLSWCLPQLTHANREV